MTKLCASCRIINRDAAIFCRGCAKRFTSDCSHRDIETGATPVAAIEANPMLRRIDHPARLWDFTINSNWPRRAPHIELTTVLLSAIVAGCAFLLWYMGG
jgi:hypothetical protein